jgi:hypothetical protein
VSIPVFESFEALNAYLLECCLRRLADRLRGHGEALVAHEAKTRRVYLR